MLKKAGLPVTLKMRHDAHYIEQLTSFSGAAVGRMIRLDQIRPNPEQPRKALGDLGELTDSVRAKGVLEPLLVRFVTAEGCFYIISGERRYHAARAAGLREVPCIEKTADEAETLEIGLIENIQRKDLTPFEEADGLHRLATQFEYTHEDIAKKIGRARSSVTETLSLRNIPEGLRKKCVEHGINLEIAVVASCSPAHREENAGDVSANPAGRIDARRSSPRAARGSSRSAAAATLHFSLRTAERVLQIPDSV